MKTVTAPVLVPTATPELRPSGTTNAREETEKVPGELGGDQDPPAMKLESSTVDGRLEPSKS
jgi:hypothetical protein